MNRFLESEATTSVERRAQALLRTMGPLELSDERVARIRERLDAPRARPIPRRSTTALLVAAVLLVAVAAAAAVGSALRPGAMRPTSQTPLPASSTVGLTIPTVDANAVTGPPQPEPTATASAAPQVAPNPVASTEPSERQVAGHGPALPPSGRPHVGPPVVASGDALDTKDVALIHDAAKALRRDHDPEEAAKLLAKVSRKNDGPLAEEALALSIQAAVARKDPKAATLARDYLSRYPQGRYRDTALRAVKQDR